MSRTIEIVTTKAKMQALQRWFKTVEDFGNALALVVASVLQIVAPDVVPSWFDWLWQSVF